jgi:hypothetical protein
MALIGNDLGYFSEYYVKETPVYKKNIIKTDRFKPIEAIEYRTIMQNKEYTINRGNGYFYTNSQFLAAKQWLEELVCQVNIPVYDTSEFGCSQKYLQKISLKKYLNDLYANKRRKKR